MDKPVKSAAEFYRRSQNDGTLKLAILRSMFCELENIEMLLEKRNPATTEAISKNTVRVLITFLGSFQEATRALEADRRPTLHLPYCTRQKLQALRGHVILQQKQ